MTEYINVNVLGKDYAELVLSMLSLISDVTPSYSRGRAQGFSDEYTEKRALDAIDKASEWIELAIKELGMLYVIIEQYNNILEEKDKIIEELLNSRKKGGGE